MSLNFSKYRNKSIIVLGGGTSTLDTHWENLDYDVLWSCNDFYKESRILNQELDLYMLGFQTNLEDTTFVSKLRKNKPFVFVEPQYNRGKENTDKFKLFEENIGQQVVRMNIPFNDQWYSPAQKAGATFRLIQLALMTEAKTVYFAGLDGFNKEFSNIHAFSKHKGLKDTDTRRDWKTGYYDVFVEAYKYLAAMKDSHRLQNLGEGLDYNLGTEISKKFFPLKKEVYDKIR